MRVEKITDEIRDKVEKLIECRWGSTLIVFRGKVHKADELPGSVAYYEDEIQGVITYEINNDECEIVSLDSLIEDKGIGSKLLEKAIETARKKKCKRIWLITTNDNLKSMKFYQKRGFEIASVHANAVVEARKINPKYGFEEIPIKHEVEFERKL